MSKEIEAKVRERCVRLSLPTCPCTCRVTSACESSRTGSGIGPESVHGGFPGHGRAKQPLQPN